MSSPASDSPESGNQRPRRLWVIASVSVIFLVALSLYWFYPRPQLPEEDPFPIAPLSASPYLNTRSDVAYVGSEACRICHPNEHASFRQTGMGRSTEAIDPKQIPPDAVFDHEVSKRRYRVHLQDDRLWTRESLLTGGMEEVVLNDVPLTHVVGSGSHAQTFLAEVDGFLVESPVTWYASRKAWAMSPGFDRPEHGGFQRPVSETCLYCHAGRFEAIEHSLHRMKIDEPAISCDAATDPDNCTFSVMPPGSPLDPLTGRAMTPS